jgi:hypothetical protein
MRNTKSCGFDLGLSIRTWYGKGDERNSLGVQHNDYIFIFAGRRYHRTDFKNLIPNDEVRSSPKDGFGGRGFFLFVCFECTDLDFFRHKKSDRTRSIRFTPSYMQASLPFFPRTYSRSRRHL